MKLLSRDSYVHSVVSAPWHDSWRYKEGHDFIPFDHPLFMSDGETKVWKLNCQNTDE